MGAGSNLDELVDHLCEQYPKYRRTTIERLVNRTVRSLEGWGGHPTVLAVAEATTEQLDYVESNAQLTGRGTQSPNSG